MKKIKLSILLSLLIIISGCSLLGGMNRIKYTELELNSVYLNKHDQEYRDLFINPNIEEFETRYFEGVSQEVIYLAEYTETLYDYLTQDTINRAIDVYDKIYKHSKFKVEEGKESNTVKVTISPIDIIVNNITADSVTQIYNELITLNLSETELENQYFNRILDLIEANLTNISYLEDIELEVKIELVDGYFEISDEESSIIDTYIIAY